MPRPRCFCCFITSRHRSSCSAYHSVYVCSVKCKVINCLFLSCSRRSTMLSIPDGRQRNARHGSGAKPVRPRSNASTQSSDDLSDMSRDRHLSSRDSTDNENDSASLQSTQTNARRGSGFRKFLDKMTPSNNSGGTSCKTD